MTKILITGYYGLGNIGDEAILSGIINSLQKHMNDPIISVITNNPSETRKLHNVVPIEQSFKKGIQTYFKNVLIKKELLNVIKQIDKCDVFILGGGALLQDLRIYYLPLLLSLVKVAQLKKKRTVIYGIGAGPIETKLGKFLSKKILNKSDLITVRDPMSKSVLENCGVKDVIQTADPSFGINIPGKEEIDNTLKAMNINHDERYFSTTAYNWLHDSDLYKNLSSPTSDLHYRRKIMATIYDRVIMEYNCKLLFLPTVKVDQKGYLEIMKNMSSNKNAIIMDYNSDFKSILAVLSFSDALIGMRLHSLIFATLMATPIIPLSYCGKVKSYLELIGLDNLHLNIEYLNKSHFFDSFFENLNIVWNNKSRYLSLQQKAAKRLRKKAFENARLVSELIA